MEALVCRSGNHLPSLPPSTSKLPSSKTSKSQSALLSGPHCPHLLHVAVSPQRTDPKRSGRSLIVFAKGDESVENSQLSEFQAASPPSWIGVGLGAALLFSTAFLPSVTLGPLEFLREGLYRVGSPQLWRSLFYGGVVVHLMEAAVAFYLARSVDPQNAALWFWQTFFIGFFSLGTLLQKSRQENLKQNLIPELCIVTLLSENMERSTEIVNQTSKALDMKVGNCRYFIKVTTVGTNQSYTLHVDCNDTYMEYSLAADDAEAGKALIVSSDECVDNKKIIIREVNGEFKAEMEPRVQPIPHVSCDRPFKKRPCAFWRLWIF